MNRPLEPRLHPETRFLTFSRAAPRPEVSPDACPTGTSSTAEDVSVGMGARLLFRSVVFVAAGVLAAAAGACANGDQATTAGGPAATAPADPTTPPDPEPFVPAATGVVAQLAFVAGECHDCGYVLQVHADGTVVYNAYNRFHVSEVDSATMQLLADADLDDLADGADDCGREVDGNAPILVLVDDAGQATTIDSCYTPFVDDHPVNRALARLRSELDREASPVLAEVLDNTGKTPVARFNERSDWIRIGTDGRAVVAAEPGTLRADVAAPVRAAVAALSGDDIAALGACDPAAGRTAHDYRFFVEGEARYVEGCQADDGPVTAAVNATEAAFAAVSR